jgi:hypothetical protein
MQSKNLGLSKSSDTLNRKEFMADCGRALLGLLAMPTVASISGCGPREEPMIAPLSEVLASPWKYQGKLITVKGYAVAEKRDVTTQMMPTYDYQNKMMEYSLYTYIDQKHKLYELPNAKGSPLVIQQFECFTGTVTDIFTKTPSIHEGEITATGRLIPSRKGPGYQLSVREISR